MKYLILTFFLISAFAAPIEEDEVIEDGPLALPQIEDGPMVLPQIEEGIIEAKGSDDDEVIEDAEAAFMRMMSMGYPGFDPMSVYSMFSPYGQMNPYSMMMGGGMYNPMMGGMYNPMMDMMGGMGGMNGMYPPMMDPMGGMGGMYPPMMDPMMMGGMGGMGGMNGMYPPMMDPMMGMGGMNGMYPPMMDPMMGMGGMNGMYPPMMDPMMGMGGMGMGGPLGYGQKKEEVIGDEMPFKNVDYPTDYTLECSDHCACEQVCKFNYLQLCTCRCPPKCSGPGIVV